MRILATIHETDGAGVIKADDEKLPVQIPLTAAQLKKYPPGTAAVISVRFTLHSEKGKNAPTVASKRAARDAAIAAQDAAEDAAAEAQQAQANAAELAQAATEAAAAAK